MSVPTHQNAIVVDQCGGPEVMQYRQTTVPNVGANDILIKNRVIGVNYIDTYHRTGLYPLPAPIQIGRDGAGEIVAVGSAVADFQVGDRVAYCLVNGSYSEYVAVPHSKAVRLPSGISEEVAAASMVQGLTAHYLADTGLTAGCSVLVHAAAGGVGYLLTQIAKIKGARVIATVSTEEKAQLAREAGADDIILYSKQDFLEEVKRLTNGKGVQVVYDGVGADTFHKSIKCLSPRGYMVIYGAASGPVPNIDVQILSQNGSLFLTRPNLLHFISTREEYDARCKDVFGWILEGKLKVLIGKQFALKDAAEAHRQLEGRATTGKILLLP
eukprot:TRINITY_DN4697_c0_g1_i1.p2 TRINITY_DN4697_c0_g1~~TRINITY_DN4697_c0_g1_i1.p2  ORF type:complete len:327 (-),score=85.25 TRINITY_DN4697_c0_g1_i1:1885-2865(-)